MIDQFFDFAAERHKIWLRRQDGLPWPWTDDPILGQYRFTNVYRELDATTVWLRENVRERYRNIPSELLLATVVFRWFNRMTTARRCGGPATIAARSIASRRPGDAEHLRTAILAYCGRGPYVTGAYIVRTYQGMTKLDGVLWAVENFHKCRARWSRDERLGWATMSERLRSSPGEITLEQVWQWLLGFELIGEFGAYEVVCDLRHTSLLDRAPDILTWANPGPGAMRGLSRIHERDYTRRVPRAQYIEEMREILRLAHMGHWERSSARCAPLGDARGRAHAV